MRRAGSHRHTVVAVVPVAAVAALGWATRVAAPASGDPAAGGPAATTTIVVPPPASVPTTGQRVLDTAVWVWLLVVVAALVVIALRAVRRERPAGDGAGVRSPGPPGPAGPGSAGG